MGQQLTTEQKWRSLHTDYLRFAILSLRACDQSQYEPRYLYAERPVIDAIKYSYDCLDASIEFVYLLGIKNQLPITIAENWLARSFKWRWRNLSLSDRLGMLAFAWTGQAFWQNESQFQLFADLKKIRDGLTHPLPFGTEIEFEIMSDEETAKDHVYGARRATGKFKYLNPLVEKNSEASFTQHADDLKKSDAEQAVEIMIRHAMRLEDLFFTRRTSWFAFHETSENRIFTTEELLGTITCRFDELWKPK